MKKYIIITLDVLLVGYLLFAVVAFNNPKQLTRKCTKVNIDIADESISGFLDAKEIQTILKKKGLYPLEKNMQDISPRQIEAVLSHSPFVSTAECCKTTDGHVLISITQRSPVVRIKSNSGDDYYIDENGGILPNSKYTSDLIIVTGDVSKSFARRYISILANIVMRSDFWRNQIVQINVTANQGIELIPRVGDHVVFLGYLPTANTQQQRKEDVTEYVENKLDRLEKFYRYGLSVAGWNKYERIDVQFDNQIICKKHPQTIKDISKMMATEPVPEVHEADHPSVEASAPSEHRSVATNEPAVQKKTTAEKTQKTDNHKSSNKSTTPSKKKNVTTQLSHRS